jgi:hypothetical protein
MHSAADILNRLLLAAARRRAPLWLAVVLPWCLLLSPIGIAISLAWVVWDGLRLRARVRRNWIHWIDAAVPEFEDSGALLVQATTALAQLQRARLLARIASALSGEVLSGIVRGRVRFDWRWFAASAGAALALWSWQQAQTLAPASVPKAVAAPAAPLSAIVVSVAAPRYTGAASFQSAPRDLKVPEYSVVTWCLKAPQEGADSIELSDGQVLEVGRECARWSATESLFWRWRGVRYKLLVVPDLEPQISVLAPRDMIHVLPADATKAAISVTVRDDYKVTRATLHLTLARGSGENIRFSDREMPLPGSSDPRLRSWSRAWSLAELGMEPGDELYFFVRATDNAEQAHTSVSPTYTLRLPGPVFEEDASSALPMLVKPENLRSQRQIIIDTEQLIADIKSTPNINKASVRERSETIASDQAQLRRRYGQFLGEESTLFGGDEHEHEHDGPDEKHDLISEFGHMHDESENATMFDEATKVILRRALSAMWDAEKALRAITPKFALGPEYKALDAIKKLQQADRIYLHKTAFVPPALKEEIRMTGDVVGARSYSREQAGPSQAVPQAMRELLQALGSDGALPALWQRSAHEWIGTRILDDDQRMQAQRAMQDVADGCSECRSVLRAWLRGAITETPVLLQASSQVDTPFARAWRKGATP